MELPASGTAPRDFDIEALNVELDQAKASKRGWLAGCSVFTASLGGVFLVLDIEPILAGTISGLRLGTLIIVLAIVASVQSAVVSGLLLTRSGGVSLRIDDVGVELLRSSHAQMRIAWDDPRFSLELYDFSGSPPASVRTTTRYAARMGGIETSLPQDAFRLLLSEATQHRLTVRPSKGSLWIYPASVAPIIYRIRAPLG